MSSSKKDPKNAAEIVDWNAFLREPDPEPEDDNKLSTRRKVATMGNNFKRWTEQLDPPDWRFWLLERFSLRLIEGFLRWYLSTHNVVRKSALQTTARYFSMFCNQERSQEAPYEMKQKLKRLVSGTLSDQYDLELSAHEQPPFNIDDLLFTTYHLLVWCPITFPTIRSIFQLNTLRKMMTSTSARPGTLIESSGYVHENDALKWKDIELFMVKHPEYPTTQVLLMKVRHRLNKGRRNEGVPPVYTYTERNDNLGLCVIQDILMYAFLDDAFDSEHIKCPRDIWRLTVIPEHRLSTPINFKESVKETPILRSASRNQAGLLVTDPQRALQYHQARQWEAAASESAGFKDQGTLYKYRKGAAANIRHLDEHSRNRIMGHRQGGTFANYISVMDDTQSIFMETPARKSLLSLATHASITRDPSAPQCLTPAQKDSVELDTKMVELKNECKTLRADLIMQYGQLKTAKDSGDKRSRELQKLQNKIKTRRKKLCDSTKNKARADFFRQVGNRIIESNHLGKQIEFTPNNSRIQPERITLANLEFKNRDVDKIDDEELLEDRIRSLELRLELHRLHVPSGLKAHIRFHETASDVAFCKDSEETRSFEANSIQFSKTALDITDCKKAQEARSFDADSIQFSETALDITDCKKAQEARSFDADSIQYSKTASDVADRKNSKEARPLEVLQCPVCLGRADLHPAAREFRYSRKDALQRHFKAHQLPMFFGGHGRVCDIPGCTAFSASLPRYKFHLAKNHRISL